MKRIGYIFIFLFAAFLKPCSIQAKCETPQLLLSVDYISPTQEIEVDPEGETVTLHIVSNGGFMEATLLESIQTSLEALSIYWITDVYLTNKEGIYEADLNFVVEENDSEYLRSLVVTASNGSATITQYGTLQSYSVYPSQITLIHGERGAIFLSGSELGNDYLLSSSTAGVATQVRAGTGDTLRFFVSDAGVFKCYDISQQPQVQMQDSCRVQWDSFYNTNRNCNLAPNPYVFPKSGGSVTFTYHVQNSDTLSLRRILNSYNSGNNLSWNSHMSISAVQTSSFTSEITVSCSENTSGAEIYNNTYFKNITGTNIVFIQDSWNKDIFRISLKDTLNNRFLVLSGSEQDVSYRLYRNGQPSDTIKAGSGNPLVFSLPVQPGKYHIWAERGSAAVMMAGTLTVTDDGKTVMGENWIMKQTYTAENGAFSNIDITYYDDLGYPAQIINVSASPDGNNIITPVWYDPMRRDDAKSYLPYASSSDLIQPEDQPLQKQNAFYASLYGNADANYAYAEKVYENSPLNRVLRQFTPGADFRQTTANSGTSDHYTSISYDFNDSNEVLNLLCSNDGNLMVSGYMAEATLYKTTTTSPDGRTTTEFKDSEGTIFLQRSGSGNSIQETYYAYDSRRRLRWVIQPEGSARIKALAANSSSANPYTITQADSTAQNFCFLYGYDGRNRTIQKKIPGKGREEMVYDLAGRLVAVQDSILRSQNRWMLTRYDSLGRVTQTFLFTGSQNLATRQQMQAAFDQSPYPAGIYGSQGNILLTRAEYGTAAPSYLAFEQVSGVAASSDKDSRTKGMLTYDKTLDLTTAGQSTKKYRERAYYYDSKGRVIQTVEKEPDGEILRTSVKYDFVGNPLTTVQTLEKGTNTTIQDNTGIGQDGNNTLTQVFTYDTRGRKFTSAAYLNNSLSDTWSAANYSYDELGRLVTSENGKTATQGSSALSPSTTAPVLSNTLAYNIQGWMTAQTDSLKKGTTQSTHKSLYSQTLRYHNPLKTATAKSYDGLITEWETLQYSDGTDFTLPGSTQDKNTYAFTYDNQGRLASSSRYAGGNTNPNSNFTEKNFSYDKNGNILTLTRYGAGDATIKDNFTYSYSGNRIEKLEGTHDGSAITHIVQNNSVAGTADYLYDGNGNMTFDALRHISMTYDLNNLVSTVSRNDTLLSTYTYLADGTKYKVKDSDGNGRYYIGPFCLSIEKTGAGSSAQTKAYLESIDSETGRILAIRQQTGSGANITETTSYSTVFFVKDHLGSIRAVVDSQGHILERNAYYPFGLQMTMGKAYPTISSSLSTLYPNILASTETRRDLYNGKELQTVAGTDYIDYGFRQYDPVTARWMAVDPKAEKYLPASSYIYCLDSPALFFDVAGDAIYVREYVPSVDENSNGNYYTYKYNIYTRQFEDENGNAYEGNNTDILTILEALNRIAIGYEGNKLLFTLSRSVKTVLIEIKKRNPNKPDDIGSRESGAFSLYDSAVLWDPADIRTLKNLSDNYISLAHELAHSRDRFFGLLCNNSIYNSIWFISKDGQPVKRAEISATHTENLIRKEHGIELRKYYVYNVFNQPEEGIIIEDGRSLYFNIYGKYCNEITNTNDRYKY